ncbi:MAG: DNA mismatch repair endonuclease MutL [[Clostridium] aminophilum]|uniref:DNA mismatch repair endonuclease MutL n=1 Tax=[Clostridium] aminophilum TaxID=1526 RepID=UPI0026F0619E|nr:DNA mismatch repair endonuclease MutL [[Clostridium] aminophilum]MDD6197161.1 DNA mismatch repair endonuclease MutL [[Clostridium] aminophilum]
MPEIRLLDADTINKIAAGEVIERPASVVKELMENAIDAKATAITVEIRDGGISMIRVTDNGCGIEKEQIHTAFLTHATSKIRDAVDLITVSSLGFRGEALASIASVSKVELITRTSDQVSGSRYRIEGGKELELEDIGAPEGTTFLVRDLFYNTPARRKFLKSASTEGAHVAALVEKIALSHPEISFRFMQNGQNKLHTTGNHNLKDIVYTVYGREIAGNLMPVEAGAEPVRIGGFIGKPIISRASRTFEVYFINGRFIRNPLISKAIEDAYKPYMMQHKYPFTMLTFRIDPAFIDVNVHPAKMELRFRDDELIYRMVFHTISMILRGREMIPEVSDEEPSSVSVPEEKPQTGLSSGNRTASFTGTPAASGLKAVRFQAPDAGGSNGADSGLIRGNRPEPFEKNRLRESGFHSVNGALNETNTQLPPMSESAPAVPGIVRESGETTVMPAKSEFDRENVGPTQKLVTADAQEAEMSSHSPASSGEITGDISGLRDDGNKPEKPQQLDFFEEKLLSPQSRLRHKLIGQVFDTYWLVEYNDNLYIIDQHAAHEKILYEKTMRSLKDRTFTSQLLNPPLILTLTKKEQRIFEIYRSEFETLGFEIEPFEGNDFAVRAVPDNLFSVAKKDLLLEMLDSLTEESGVTITDTLNHRIATMSCKAAIKGGNEISREEADHLIDELLLLENPYACPHGRPTIISMSRTELEKKFKRIV